MSPTEASDYPRPEWVTADWLSQQTEVEWVDGDGDPWFARLTDINQWALWLNGGTPLDGGVAPIDLIVKMDRYGVKSLTVAYNAPTPAEVTITRGQLRQAIIKAGPANPPRLLDELWATLSEGGAA